MKSKYDVVILGAGHNGLVAASYLSRAGLSVLIMEKNDYIGGATTSQKVFPDYDAWLSRYSYLVSLFPKRSFEISNWIWSCAGARLLPTRPTQGTVRHDGFLLGNRRKKLSRQSIVRN